MITARGGRGPTIRCNTIQRRRTNDRHGAHDRPLLPHSISQTNATPWHHCRSMLFFATSRKRRAIQKSSFLPNGEPNPYNQMTEKEIYTSSGVVISRDSITHRLHHRRRRQLSWDPDTPPQLTLAQSTGDYPQQTQNASVDMSLTRYASDDDDEEEEDYTSSDNDHLFMAPSPRRRSSATASQPIIPRSRTMSRCSQICICRNPSAIASAASSATAYSPVEPSIWNELRRLFQEQDPRKHFDILRRSSPAINEQGKGFVMVEARVQAKDGMMIAKGEPCTDDILSLRSLRNTLMETKGPKNLPFEMGDEIVAGKIEEFKGDCSACRLPRY